MQTKLYRLLAGITLFSIVIYGILKNWVLRFYSDIIKGFFDILNIDGESFLNILRNQSNKENGVEQTIGWALYYPTYFLLHVLFISFLFSNNIKVRNYVILGLSSVIFILISVWIAGSWFGFISVAEAARLHFRKLFGLPFILLSIEGGRILYHDLVKLTQERKSN